jgi:hypothetical protein
MSTKLIAPAAAVFDKLHDLLGALADRPVPAHPPASPREDMPRPREAKAVAAQNLEAHLVRIVRRALGKEAASSALTWRIHAVADRVGGHGWKRQPDGQEQLIRRVARVLCRRLGWKPGA